jgi:hypothetical protein
MVNGAIGKWRQSCNVRKWALKGQDVEGEVQGDIVIETAKGKLVRGVQASDAGNGICRDVRNRIRATLTL